MAPEGGWGWMVVLGSAVVHVVCTGLQSSFGVIYLDLVNRFSAGATETSLVLVLFNFTHYCLGPFASWLAKRYECRGVVITGSLIMTAGCIASAYVSSLYALYVTFGVLIGFGSCLTFAPSMIIVSNYFVKRRSKAMALSTFGNSISYIAMPPFLFWILDIYSLPGTFLICAGFSFNLCLSGALYRPLRKVYLTGNAESFEMIVQKRKCDETAIKEQRETVSQIHPSISTSDKCEDLNKLEMTHLAKRVEKDNTKSAYIASESTSQKQKRDSRNLSSLIRKFLLPEEQMAVLRIPSFIIYALTIFSMPVNNMSFYTFLPSLLKSTGATEGNVAIVYATSGACDIIGRFSFGFLFDLKLVKSYRVLLQGTAGVMTGLVTLVIPHVTSHVLITIICCLRTLVMSGFNAQRVTVMADLIPVHQVASGVGILLFFQGMGSSMGFVVSGVLKDALHSLSMPFYYGGLTMAGFCLIYTCHQGVKIVRTKKSAKNTDGKETENL